jgi:hypothetical protein
LSRCKLSGLDFNLHGAACHSAFSRLLPDLFFRTPRTETSSLHSATRSLELAVLRAIVAEPERFPEGEDVHLGFSSNFPSWFGPAGWSFSPLSRPFTLGRGRLRGGEKGADALGALRGERRDC